jgi:hypothetical protein
MFTVKKNLIYKSGKQFSTLAQCVCTSDVIIHDKKHYINVKIEPNSDLKELDLFCQTTFKNFSSFLKNDIIFVKLPFRYKRYDIKFNNLTACGCFQKDETFKCELLCCGFININDYKSLCFKVTTVF